MNILERFRPETFKPERDEIKLNLTVDIKLLLKIALNH